MSILSLFNNFGISFALNDVHDTQENLFQTEIEEIKCGSCYGAEKNSTHCCNTCQDVIDSYREKKWNPNIDDFVQCKNEKRHDSEKAKAAFKEGCQVYGHMEVNRVSIY